MTVRTIPIKHPCRVTNINPKEPPTKTHPTSLVSGRLFLGKEMIHFVQKATLRSLGHNLAYPSCTLRKGRIAIERTTEKVP
jgi:hypothetical protein